MKTNAQMNQNFKHHRAPVFLLYPRLVQNQMVGPNKRANIYIA